MRCRGAAVVVALIVAALAACAPLTPVPTGEAGRTVGMPGVAERIDLSGRFIALIGPKAQHAPPYLGTPGTNFYCLRSFIDRQTSETAHQLYVAASYDSIRDWDAAKDNSGQSLKFIAINRHQIACEGGCSYAEEFAAKLAESELHDNPRGFTVIFGDRAGDTQTIAVSAAQIAVQLAAVQAQLAKLPATALAGPAPP